MRHVLPALVLIFSLAAEASAMIDPAFQGLARIGFLCRVDPPAADGSEVAARVCERAARLAASRLPRHLPAVALADFDPQVTDPKTLLVTLHVHRLPDLWLLALGLHRQGTPPGDLFPAAPQAVPLEAGEPVPAHLDRALDALLDRPVLRPFATAPGGPMR